MYCDQVSLLIILFLDQFNICLCELTSLVEITHLVKRLAYMQEHFQSPKGTIYEEIPTFADIGGFCPLVKKSATMKPCQGNLWTLRHRHTCTCAPPNTPQMAAPFPHRTYEDPLDLSAHQHVVLSLLEYQVTLHRCSSSISGPFNAHRGSRHFNRCVTGVSLWLSFAFFWWLRILHLFSCASLPLFYYLLWKVSPVFCPFSNWTIWLLLLSFLRVLYMVYLLVFCQIWGLKIFPPSLSSVFLSS